MLSALKESLDEASIRVFMVTDKKMQGNVHATDKKDAIKKAREVGMKPPIKVVDKGEYKGQPRLVDSYTILDRIAIKIQERKNG